MPADWQRYFSELGNGELRFPQTALRAVVFNRSAFSIRQPVRSPALRRLPDPEIAAMQDRVYLLIRLYRVRGHRIAQVDPLGLPRPTPEELEPEFFGFTEADMDLPV